MVTHEGQAPAYGAATVGSSHNLPLQPVMPYALGCMHTCASIVHALGPRGPVCIVSESHPYLLRVMFKGATWGVPCM